MDLQILPLAITMMAGPQIMSAIILVTARRAVRTSLAFLAGVTVSVVAGVAVTRGIFALLGHGISVGGSGSGSAEKIIQLVLVALLLAAAVKNYVRRETIEPPKWLGALMDATPRKALRTGLLVIVLMPSDIMVMLTVGAHLEQHGVSLAGALPFIAATVLIAALPLLALLLFHKRAVRAMPGVREWMNTHSWLINIICCLIFIVIIL